MDSETKRKIILAALVSQSLANEFEISIARRILLQLEEPAPFQFYGLIGAFNSCVLKNDFTEFLTLLVELVIGDH